MKHEKIKPYKNSYLTKKKQVKKMFDRISPYYDLTNRILSFGIDVQWRKKLVFYLNKFVPNHILDVASGTGDLAILSARQNPKAHIIAVDFSEKMLHLARKKIIYEKLDSRIKILNVDVERMPFKENNFDAVIVAFGIRNFETLSSGLCEMYRVLRSSGHLLILEFSSPIFSPIKELYYFYSKYILPFIGNLFSKDRNAYAYLKESITSFPCGKDMEDILLKTGFHDVQLLPLTFGIATIYIARKKNM